MIELENGNKYVLHNSPHNKGEKGHEIVIRDSVLTKRWEIFSEWHEVKGQHTIDDLILPVQYRIITSNCIHTVKRIWKILVPDVKFAYVCDPEIKAYIVNLRTKYVP